MRTSEEFTPFTQPYLPSRLKIRKGKSPMGSDCWFRCIYYLDQTGRFLR